jgi:hypothetical protein
MKISFKKGIKALTFITMINPKIVHKRDGIIVINQRLRTMGKKAT